VSLLPLWVRRNRKVRRPLRVVSALRLAVHRWVGLPNLAASGRHLVALPNPAASVRRLAAVLVGLRPLRRLLPIRTVRLRARPPLPRPVSSTSPSTLWVARWSPIPVRSILTANLSRAVSVAHLAVLLRVAATVVLLQVVATAVPLQVVATVRLIRAVRTAVAAMVARPLAVAMAILLPAAPAGMALLLQPVVAMVALQPVAAMALRRAAATARPQQHRWAATVACRVAARRWSPRAVAVPLAKLEIRSWCW
jgi:hypothetical protein